MTQTSEAGVAGTSQRKTVVDKTANWLSGSLYSERSSDLQFIANQIILDLEEVFVNPPFGVAQTQDVYFGPGGKAGLDAMRKDVDLSMKCSDNALCGSLLDAIKDATTQELCCLGMYRDRDGQVRVHLNKRIVTIFDAEHMLCKTAMLLRKTQPQRVTSNTSPFIVNCHPVKVVGNWNAKLYWVAKDAVDAFLRVSEQEPLQIPEQYSHPADHLEGGIFYNPKEEILTRELDTLHDHGYQTDGDNEDEG